MNGRAEGESSAGSSRKRRRKLTDQASPVSTLAHALHLLPASGPHSFEGLVASLLTELTGVRFLPRRSGLQDGRDLESFSTDSATVFVECKRYGATSELSQRELVSEIDIARRSEPRLDLYVLATTKGQDASIRRELASKATDEGLDFAMLSCGPEGFPEELDTLCAAYPELVRHFCSANNLDTNELLQHLEVVAKLDSHSPKLDTLRHRFKSENVGLPTFRALLNEAFQRSRSDHLRGRTHYGRPIGPTDFVAVDVARELATSMLTSFSAGLSSQTEARVCVVMGAEGNGKSWAVARWISEQIQQGTETSFFWLSPNSCRTKALDNIPENVAELLQSGEPAQLRAKMKRWFSVHARNPAVVVLDGVNERQTTAFWARYILGIVSSTTRDVKIILTCRPSTWVRDLKTRLGLPAVEISLEAFNLTEFSTAMKGQTAETIEQLWGLGEVARKPRYLGIALAYLRRGGDAKDLTLEKLYYEYWKHRVTTRIDYPITPEGFERLLVRFARSAQEILSPSQVNQIVRAGEDEAVVINELVSSEVIDASDDGDFRLRRNHLTPAIGMLLHGLIKGTPGDIQELRAIVAEHIQDTWQSPLTAEICIFAALLAIEDQDTRDEVVAALTVEALVCQNLNFQSIRGLIRSASLRLDVFQLVTEELWLLPRVDGGIEQEMLWQFIELCGDESVRNRVLPVLERWASFVHEQGETDTGSARSGRADERGELAKLRIEQHFAVPGRHPLTEDGNWFLTRVQEQRSLRLARLAVAVASTADRSVFFRVPAIFLIANAVMGTYRSQVALWVIGSSTVSLDAHIECFIEVVRQVRALSDEEKTSLERHVLEAAAIPRRTSRLKSLRSQFYEQERNQEWQRLLRRPTREEMLEVLRRDGVDRLGLEAAATYASDRTFEYPPEFNVPLRNALHAIPASSLGCSTGQSREDLDWEHLTPLACRLLPEEYQRFVSDFLRDVGGRSRHAAFTWTHKAEGLGPLVGPSEVRVLRETWDQLVQEPPTEDAESKHLEAALFSMLLPHLTPMEQVSTLLRRGNSRRNYLSFANGFRQLESVDEQASIASLVVDDDDLHHVLWFATTQNHLEASIWLPLVERGARSADTVARALSAKILFRLSEHHTPARLSAFRAPSADACPLEKHWVSLLQLMNPDREARERLAMSSLEACAELVGQTVIPDQARIAAVFSDELIAWASNMVQPDRAGAAEVPMSISGSIPRRGYVSVGVDHAQIDNSVTYRSEMSTWGGLSQDDSGEALRRSTSGGKTTEMYDALNRALAAASQDGDWGYRASWSDSTVRVLFQLEGFERRFFDLWEIARSRRRLRSIGGFLRAAVRYLLLIGHERAFELWSELVAQKAVVRHIDSFTGNDLLEEAYFRHPDAKVAHKHWLKRIDASQSDAHVLACCELLVAGGHASWLWEQGASDLMSEAPYQKRRGLLLLAGSGEDVERVRATIDNLGERLCGVEDVQKVADGYCNALINMRHWVEAMYSATSVVAAKCASELVLHCADHRIWGLLATCGSHASRCGVPVELLLPESKIKAAVKDTLKERAKSLYGYRKLPLDVHPWLPVGTDLCIELRF